MDIILEIFAVTLKNAWFKQNYQNDSKKLHMSIARLTFYLKLFSNAG